MILKVQTSWLGLLNDRALNRVFPPSGAGFVAHLYTNDVTPTGSDSLGDFVEASGGGYVPVTLGSWTGSLANLLFTASSGNAVWNFTAALTGGATVRGLFLTDSAGNLVAAGRSTLNSGAGITPANYKRLTVPVTLQWGVGTPAANALPTAPVISLYGVASGQVTLRLDTASTDAEDGTIHTYAVYGNGVLSGGDRTWNVGGYQTVTGLVNGVAVAITARGKDSTSALGAVSNTINVTPANQAPTAPVLTVRNTGDSLVSVELTTASTDTEDGTLTTYEVYVGGVKFGADQTAWLAGTTRTLTPLTNDVQVAITAKGKDSAGLLGSVSATVYGTPSGVVDTTPNQFTFTDVTNVALSSTQTSNAITVSGINAASAISVTGGAYKINSGSWVASAGTVSNGDTVQVQHTASAIFSTATNTTLTIGGVSDTFTSTTLAADTTPNAFTFTDQTGVARNTLATSAAITISGINTDAPLSITGGEWLKNGFGTWSTASSFVANGDTVQVRHTSSVAWNTSVNTTLTVGGVSDTFTSTTMAQDLTPDAFTFNDTTGLNLSAQYLSNAIILAGINDVVTISITGGEYEKSTDGGTTWGAWTSAAGTASVGDRFVLRMTTSASYSTAKNAVFTAGNTSDTWTLTTRAADTTPDAFTFTDITNATPSTTYTSNAITVAGIEAPCSVSVTGGQYQISTNGGSTWGSLTSSAGTVALNDQVRVQVTSSGSGSTAVNCTLTLNGNVSDTYTVTTAAAGPSTPTQSALTVASGQLTANWTDVTGETSYTVYYSDNSGLTGTTRDGTNAYDANTARSGKITGIAANSVSQVITGLTNGTTYYVKVSASNAGGESALSSSQSAAPGATSSGVNELFTSGLGAFSGGYWFATGGYAFPNSDAANISTAPVVLSRGCYFEFQLINSIPGNPYRQLRFGLVGGSDVNKVRSGYVLDVFYYYYDEDDAYYSTFNLYKVDASGSGVSGAETLVGTAYGPANVNQTTSLIRVELDTGGVIRIKVNGTTLSDGGTMSDATYTSFTWACMRQGTYNTNPPLNVTSFKADVL